MKTEPFTRLATRLRRSAGFTLIEVLVVLAVIGIMAAIVITTMANAAQQTREILARQQQVSVQSAVSNWVANPTPSTMSVNQLRTMYNGAGNARARLVMISSLLDPSTYQHLLTNSPTSDTAKIKSDAMVRTGKWLELPNWAPGSYPQVELKP